MSVGWWDIIPFLVWFGTPSGTLKQVDKKPVPVERVRQQLRCRWQVLFSAGVVGLSGLSITGKIIQDSGGRTCPERL